MSNATNAPAAAAARVDADERRRANVALLKRLLVVALGMFGFGYALVTF